MLYNQFRSANFLLLRADSGQSAKFIIPAKFSCYVVFVTIIKASLYEAISFSLFSQIRVRPRTFYLEILS